MIKIDDKRTVSAPPPNNPLPEKTPKPPVNPTEPYNPINEPNEPIITKRFIVKAVVTAVVAFLTGIFFDILFGVSVVAVSGISLVVSKFMGKDG